MTLPLDEVIRQLPGDAFTLSSPIVDVRGIEDFPPPFQPHVPPPSQERQGAPVADVARPLTLESFADVTRRPEPEPEPQPEVEPVAEREPEPLPVMSETIVVTDREAVAEPEMEREPEPERVRFADATEREVVPVALHEPEPPRVSAPLIERRRRAEPSRVAALLKPILSALEVQEQRVGRLTVLSVASPELAADAVVESAAALAPLLDDRRRRPRRPSAALRAPSC